MILRLETRWFLPLNASLHAKESRVLVSFGTLAVSILWGSGWATWRPGGALYEDEVVDVLHVVPTVGTGIPPEPSFVSILWGS